MLECNLSLANDFGIVIYNTLVALGCIHKLKRNLSVVNATLGVEFTTMHFLRNL
jgi:hypothetical protein